jgi:hypothetical protein
MKSFRQLRHLIEVTIGRSASPELPPTILLRRVAIRSFPDGKQVAIYKDTRSGAEYAIPPVQEEIMK